MSTSTTPARVPGWERVLDAFVAAPDRILTNVELGMIPGVQAFHQRITDLERFGYVLTSAVQLKPGYYAYALVGRSPRFAHVPAPGGKTRPAPHVDTLPIVGDDAGAYSAAITRAVTSIDAKHDALLKRTAPSIAVDVIAAHHRVIRDCAAVLAEAIDGARLAAIDAASRGDLLVLAHAARDEIVALRTLRTLVDFHAEAWARVRSALADSGEVEDVGDLGLHDLVNAAVSQCKRPLPVTGFGHRRARAAGRGPTGPQLMRKALEHHEQPMHSAKMAAWVMANGGDAVYKGATPAATMGAQLATSNKDGGEFVKVAPGCYALREWKDTQDQFGNDLLELDPIR